MVKSIKCPNCKAPVEPNPESPTLRCAYCAHHFENVYYRSRDRKTQSLPAKKNSTKLVLLVLLVPLLIGLVSALVTLGGLFSKSPATTPLTTSPEPAASPPLAPSDPHVALEEKLDGYNACLSTSYPRARDSMKRYLSWQKSPQKGPNCKERYITWGMYSLLDGTPERCSRSVAEANAKPPALTNLHQAGLAYVAAVSEAYPLFKEGAEYYDKKMYKLDGCARAQSLHPLLVGAFERLTAARQNLRAAITQKTRGALQRCLERNRAEPDWIAGFRWTGALKVCGDLVVAFRSQAAAAKPDMDVVKSWIARVNTAISILDDLTTTQKNAVGFRQSHKNKLDGFVASSMAFLSSKAGKKLDSSARFWLRNGHPRSGVTGTFEKIVADYQALLGDFGDLKTCGTILSCDDSQCPEPR